MKKITRPPKISEITIDKVENYQQLYNNKGKIKPRWNYESNKILKEELLKMTNAECVYCGKKININDFDVEHFLPKSEFPYLSYSYLNLLASCKICNQNLKRNKYPKSLDKVRKQLGEEYLVGEIDGIEIVPFEKSNIFNKTKDRLIDPSFDNPEEHLDFDPITCEYTVKNNSSIGKETNGVFFRENKDYSESLQLLSSLIKKMLEEGSSKELILQNLSTVYGNSYHIEKIYKFWIEMLGEVVSN